MPESFTDTPLLTDRFDRALALASAHHRRQLRKGTTIPYVAHLLAVTSIVLEIGGDEDEAIGALLHDAVEDGGGASMLARIRAEFGDAVALIVEANSDTDVEPKPPWRERKEAYLAGMTVKPAAALRVSLADKLHNARSITADRAAIGDELWTRFSASREQTCWYYASLVAAFEARGGDLGENAQGALAELRALVDGMAEDS